MYSNNRSNQQNNNWSSSNYNNSSYTSNYRNDTTFANNSNFSQQHSLSSSTNFNSSEDYPAHYSARALLYTENENQSQQRFSTVSNDDIVPTKKERRGAIKVLQRIKDIPRNELSEADRISLAWATKIAHKTKKLQMAMEANSIGSDYGHVILPERRTSFSPPRTSNAACMPFTRRNDRPSSSNQHERSAQNSNTSGRSNHNLNTSSSRTTNQHVPSRSSSNATSRNATNSSATSTKPQIPPLISNGMAQRQHSNESRYRNNERQEVPPRVTQTTTSRQQQQPRSSNNDEPLTKRNKTTSTSADKTSTDDKEQIILAVIDASKPDNTISIENWKEIEIKLVKIFVAVVKECPGKAPTCRDYGWHQNRIKLIACADQRSADLYLIAVSRLGEVWPGAKIRVLSHNEVLYPPNAYATVPAQPESPQEILEIIQLSNPDVPTDTWKVIKVEEQKGIYRNVKFLLNQDSLGVLAKKDGVLNYGFSSITMKVNEKQNDKRPSSSKATPEKYVEDKPLIPRAKAWLPFTPKDDLSILRVLQTCNPQLHTQNWIVAKVMKPVGAIRQVLFHLDVESLEPLNKSNCIINYGFGKVKLHINKNDVEAINEKTQKTLNSRR